MPNQPTIQMSRTLLTGPRADRVTNFDPDPIVEWQSVTLGVQVTNPRAEPLDAIVVSPWDPSKSVPVHVDPQSSAAVTLETTAPAGGAGLYFPLELRAPDLTMMSWGTEGVDVWELYSVAINQIHCQYPTTKREFGGDTDHLTLAACQIRQPGASTQTKTHSEPRVADQDTRQITDMRIGPFAVYPSATWDGLRFSYAMFNAGHQAAAQAAQDFDNEISNLTASALTALFPAGGFWDKVNTATQWLNRFFTGNCDGPILADIVNYTTVDLEKVTAQGPHSETRSYHHDFGDFSFACQNADYTVGWTVWRAGPTGS